MYKCVYLFVIYSAHGFYPLLKVNTYKIITCMVEHKSTLYLFVEVKSVIEILNLLKISAILPFYDKQLGLHDNYY